MIRFFELITIPTSTDTSITQELLSLVTGLAQNLKSLIRIGLSAALHLVRGFFFSCYFKKINNNNNNKKKLIYIKKKRNEKLELKMPSLNF
jgi:hypothetical protein